MDSHALRQRLAHPATYGYARRQSSYPRRAVADVVPRMQYRRIAPSVDTASALRRHPQPPATVQPVELPVSRQASDERGRAAEPITSVHPRCTRRGFRTAIHLRSVIMAAAAIIFIAGSYISLTGFTADRAVQAQARALTLQANNAAKQSGSTSVLSSTKPSAATLADYVVAPDLPRYLKIPKLGVDARVLSVGVTSTGALATPDNVFDTAWYNESAEPGQPGAVLIDGHISSWTSRGVFYGLKDLVAGDTIQIDRGDGKVFTYKVVKSKTYSASNVDMEAAMTPVVPGTPGLNLISCSGDVIPGTSQFDERIVVFAEQVD